MMRSGPVSIVLSLDGWIIDHPAQRMVQFAADHSIPKRTLIIGGQLVAFAGLCADELVLSHPSPVVVALLAILAILTSASAANPTPRTGAAERFNSTSLFFRLVWALFFIWQAGSFPFSHDAKTVVEIGVDLSALFALYVAATGLPKKRSPRRAPAKVSTVIAARG